MGQIDRCKKNQDGTTMVSVIVGFVLLLMIMVLLQQVVNYSYHMLERASELRTATDELCEEYYTDQSPELGSTVSEVADLEYATLPWRNANNASDSFTSTFDLNRRYTTEASIFYFGEHELVTGTGGGTP